MTTETVLLDEVLRPSPPMAPRVLQRILAGVVAVNLAIALYFVARGAWPIAPFLGLDVVLLAWAFRVSTVAAQREERITLTNSELAVARRIPNKPARNWTFNPYWVRVELAEADEHWSQLKLWSHGKFLQIGQFLAPAERAKFAVVLRDALLAARRSSI
jgi:uncharacterized membrane protein